MLTGTELRIGNLLAITVPYPPPMRGFKIKYVTVTEISYDFVKYDDEDAIDLSCFNPIPLTEEWLLKLGFDKNMNRHPCLQKKKDNYTIDVWPDGDLLIEINKPPRFKTPSKILYVHELQNFYYTFFGEELTIKEPISDGRPTSTAV